jgi:hypothetical protein
MGFLDFPKLNTTQYALLICQANTGNILDEKLERYKDTGSNNVFFLFDSLDEAKFFIKEREIDNIDFEVFNANKESVLVISIPPTFKKSV